MKCDRIEFHSAGRFSSPSSEFVFPERSSAEAQLCELLYVTDGRLDICEDYCEYHLEKGQVLLLEKGQRRYGLSEAKTPVSFLRMFFSEGGEDETGTEPVLRKVTTPDNPALLESLWQTLIECTETPEYPSRFCRELARLLLTELVLHGRDASGEGCTAQRIADWIRDEAPSDVRVSDAAAHFGYSEDHITRIFKAFYSMGIKSYIDSVRTVRIKNDLLISALPIPRVVARNGFSGSDALHKFFKANTGMTCSEFKKLYTKI